MNWIPPNDSKIWSVIYLLAVSGVFIAMMHFVYANGFDVVKDGATLVTVLGALAGIFGVRNFMAPDGKDKP